MQNKKPDRLLSKVLKSSLLFSWHCKAEENYEKAWKEARTQKLTRKLTHLIKGSFNSSFIARITDINEKKEANNFKDSFFLKRAAMLYGTAIKKLTGYSKMSNIALALTKVKEDIASQTVKKIGIITIVCILTNILFSNAIGRSIDMFGWIVRASFIFAGIAALLCKNSWEEVKNASIIFKMFIKKGSSGS